MTDLPAPFAIPAGLGDIAIGVTAPFLAPSTDLLRLLPLALVPTAAVSFAVALHITALHQLRTTKATPAPVTAAASTPSNPGGSGTS